MNISKRHMISALLGVGLAALLIWGFNDPKPKYRSDKGKVFGTYYSIQYEATADLKDSISAAFQAFDGSLSMFNPQSVLSAINANRDTTTDAFFEAMFDEAALVYALSDGAFDITVAPLVKAFGFGRKSDQYSAISPQTIDSLRTFVGFDKVALVNHRVVKDDYRIQLDAGAVAKGQACDVIAEMLQRNGSTNYLIEIGGEIVSRGVNSKGQPWHIGITKPNPDNEGAAEDLQEILQVNNICMATSGNYRNFYYEGDERRSHTIDPRTGYPVQHSVLSATVISSSCMRADALATACMVLGEDEAMQMMERAEDAACYLIIAQNDSLATVTSPNWQKMLTK